MSQRTCTVSIAMGADLCYFNIKIFKQFFRWKSPIANTILIFVFRKVDTQRMESKKSRQSEQCCNRRR